MVRLVLVLVVVAALALLACAHTRLKAPAKEIWYINRAKAFHEKWGNETGVVTLPSGLQYKVLRLGGNTTHPLMPHDKVEVRFQIFLPDEETPYRRLIGNNMYEKDGHVIGIPGIFGLRDMLPGWRMGLELMSEGDRFELYVPHNFAYGRYGRTSTRPAIPVFSPLIIDTILDRIITVTEEQAAAEAAAHAEALAAAKAAQEEANVKSQATAKEQGGEQKDTKGKEKVKENTRGKPGKEDL